VLLYKEAVKTLFCYHPSKLLLVIIFYLSIHNSVLLTLKTISKTPSYMYENPIGDRFMYLLQFILIAVCFLCIIFVFFCFCFRKSCKTSECSFFVFLFFVSLAIVLKMWLLEKCTESLKI